MPFPMSHLIIGQKVLDKETVIADHAGFLLGTLAPDSVHFRNNYTGEYKKVSHLCVGNEKWGECTNNTEWINNVLKFLNEHKDSIDIDFYYGYCVHILSDIIWNINFWTPYRLYCIKKHGELRGVDGTSWQKECRDLDVILYKECEDDNMLWNNIKIASSIDIPGVAVAEEIDKIRDNILNHQYKNRQSNRCENNKLVSMEETKDFINEASEHINSLI